MPAFTAALFLIAQVREQPKCPREMTGKETVALRHDGMLVAGRKATRGGSGERHRVESARGDRGANDLARVWGVKKHRRRRTKGHKKQNLRTGPWN